MSSEQQYFLWADDVPIAFTVNDLDEWVVDGANLIEMVRSIVWQQQQGDFSPEGAITPQQAIESIVDVVSLYRPGVDEKVLPGWVKDSCPVCDSSGNELGRAGLCSCGHAIDAHQTGEGPWSGFCGGEVDSGGCECESPEVK
jgi:hypothetical protein